MSETPRDGGPRDADDERTRDQPGDRSGHGQAGDPDAPPSWPSSPPDDPATTEVPASDPTAEYPWAQPAPRTGAEQSPEQPPTGQPPAPGGDGGQQHGGQQHGGQQHGGQQHGAEAGDDGGTPYAGTPYADAARRPEPPQGAAGPGYPGGYAGGPSGGYGSQPGGYGGGYQGGYGDSQPGGYGGGYQGGYGDSQPGGYAAPVTPTPTSTIVLLVISVLATLSCWFTLAGVAPLIIAIVALNKNRTAPEESQRLTRTGWIVLAVGAAVMLLGVILFAGLALAAGP